VRRVQTGAGRQGRQGRPEHPGPVRDAHRQPARRAVPLCVHTRSTWPARTPKGAPVGPAQFAGPCARSRRGATGNAAADAQGQGCAQRTSTCAGIGVGAPNPRHTARAWRAGVGCALAPGPFLFCSGNDGRAIGKRKDTKTGARESFLSLSLSWLTSWSFLGLPRFLSASLALSWSLLVSLDFSLPSRASPGFSRLLSVSLSLFWPPCPLSRRPLPLSASSDPSRSLSVPRPPLAHLGPSASPLTGTLEWAGPVIVQ
jgi:hypothetical protein